MLNMLYAFSASKKVGAQNQQVRWLHAAYTCVRANEDLQRSVGCGNIL